MKTRLLALLLAGAVTASLLGVSALAAEEDEPEKTGAAQTQEEAEDGQEAGETQPEEEP